MNRSRLTLKLVTIVLFSALVFGGCQTKQLSQKPAEEQIAKVKEIWFKNKAGAYETVVKYETPAGEEQNTFRLAINNGVVIKFEMDITTKITDSISPQQGFRTEIGKTIVGKKIAELAPFDAVSGASLTTTAFNEALLKLKAQLKS